MSGADRRTAGILVFAYWLSLSIALPIEPHEQSWKALRNDKYNICIEYPAAQFAILGGESRDGNTIIPKKLVQNGHRLPWPAPYTAFGFGGWVVQPKDVSQPDVSGSGPRQTLEDDYDGLLQAGREHWHLQSIKVISKRRSYADGLPILDVAVEFRYGPSGTRWYYRERLMHTKNDGEAYHLSLTCPTSELKNLLPIYERMVASFRLHCKK
ncbi:MAG TPA: hypothetical protein VKB26_02870 [Candidatus Acidoferrales bacterium]|nr:hypothetical protein [Candidatus Acidoferrales bacterium]